MSLIKLIIKDPVKYPDNMSEKFKDFLKGLLNKDPARRLNWPNLLHHPFQKETEEEEKERRKRTEKYKQWIGLNFQKVVEGKEDIVLENGVGEEAIEVKPENDNKTKVMDPQKFEDYEGNYNNNDNIDNMWKAWMTEAQDPKLASQLRKNTIFLESLLKNLQMNMGDILKSTDKRSTFQHGLRILSLMVLNSDDDFHSQIDILKNKHQPINLINKIKQILKTEDFSAEAQEISSCLTMATAQVSKAYYDSNEGIETIFSKNFLQLIPTMLDIGAKKLTVNPSLLSNSVKAIGQLANQASSCLPRNSIFYEELTNSKIIEQLAKIQNTPATTTKFIEQQNNIINVFSILVHPIYGEMFTFPWNRGPLESKQFL